MRAWLKAFLETLALLGPGRRIQQFSPPFRYRKWRLRYNGNGWWRAVDRWGETRMHYCGSVGAAFGVTCLYIERDGFNSRWDE